MSTRQRPCSSRDYRRSVSGYAMRTSYPAGLETRWRTLYIGRTRKTTGRKHARREENPARHEDAPSPSTLKPSALEHQTKLARCKVQMTTVDRAGVRDASVYRSYPTEDRLEATHIQPARLAGCCRVERGVRAVERREGEGMGGRMSVEMLETHIEGLAAYKLPVEEAADVRASWGHDTGSKARDQGRDQHG
ncbi:hypothetical protein FA13DRAFT_1709157 [Coprinellus micaceus]|uniref:Uncharacterized protein n=1 Tax=Coprinellus micaceus TaxID=71717 RepID=A0A4Y7TEZ4_COPMI|nr:hypothetical protein FA13DRAFT_1709157 [Coprinellus micaceus]